jgi:hypothetical protein
VQILDYQEALEFCHDLLKLTRRVICLMGTGVSAVEYIDQTGPFQLAGKYILKFCLPCNVYACELGLLHYSFVNIQAA